jgi:hypothetical protein
MNEQQLEQLSTLIEAENPAAIKAFITSTIPLAEERNNFILGEVGVRLFKEADENGYVLSVQALHDLLPNQESQRQLLALVATNPNDISLDNERSLFEKIVVYGSTDLLRSEIQDANIASLDLILCEKGVSGFEDAVNFNKIETVQVLIQALESQDDRVMLIKTMFGEVSDSFVDPLEVRNMLLTLLEELNPEKQKDLILGEVGIDAFERMVINDQVDSVNLVLNYLDNDQKMDLVSSIDSSIEHESPAMRVILDDLSQENSSVSSDGSELGSYNSGNEVSSDYDNEMSSGSEGETPSNRVKLPRSPTADSNIEKHQKRSPSPSL